MLQINLNHARRAQDLLAQFMNERDASVAIISEPYRVPAGDPQWIGSADGLTAIVWRRTRSPLPCTRAFEGRGYVAIRWGGMCIVSVYLSPRLSIAEVEDRLDGLSREIRAIGNIPVIVAGDFNAHATMWGSRATNARGRLLIDWAAANGLQCANQGGSSTCVRVQGESIVDLTWVSPGAARLMRDWKVLSNTESLSDQVYVEIVLSDTGEKRSTASRAPPRWSLKKLDEDKLIAALLIESWPGCNEEEDTRRESQKLS